MAKQDLFAGFGVEAYQARVNRKVTPGGQKRDQAHLILLAKNKTGIDNLMMLNYYANTEGGYYVPRVDWELLEQYHEGIIATSACVAGLVARGVVNEDDTALNKFQHIFGDDFFVEIHTYTKDKDMTGIGDDPDIIVNQMEMNNELVSICRERGIPMVYANDAHYACQGDYPFHEVLLASQFNKSLKDPTRMSHPKPCLYIMGEDVVRETLSYLPDSVVDEAIANSDLIASLCKETQLVEPGRHLPVFVPKEITDETNAAILIRLTKAGLEDRYGTPIPKDAEERALYELRTIIGAGLADYFLITHDFCAHADAAGILRGPGRGSAAGSILAYALGITHVDPLKYGLYFERFYNIGREKGLPDIDIDFVNERRNEIDTYLRKRWGEHNVLPIGTHIRMKPLQAITKMAKVFDIPFNDVEEIKGIVKSVPDINIISADQIGWFVGPGIKVAVLEEEKDGQTIEREQYELLRPFMKRYPNFFDAVYELTGKLFTYGIHASAIIISDVDIRKYIPVTLRTEESGGKKMLASQIEMKELDKLGFPKFDRLGLKTLDVLDEVAAAIGEDRNFWWHIDWESLPEDFWKQIERGNTLGLFQVEDGMAKSIGKRMKPRSIEDLAAIVALNRPGPLRQIIPETGQTAVETFLRCRSGEQEVQYPHEFLEDILAPTQGIFLFQEQVINYFSKIGYDPVMADEIRNILGKKLAVKMQEEHPRYMEYATRHIDEASAQKIWEAIETFSLYSFNKAHSVSYAFILAATMYAKFYHTILMFMSCIHKAKDRDERGQFVMEARRMGIEVHHPDINRSEISMASIDGEIYFGLSDVKNVGQAAKWVIKNRPYADFDDFMQKHEAQQDAWEAQEERKGKSARQQITSRAIDCLWKAGAFGERDDATASEIADDEEELLGVALTTDIPDVLAEYGDKFEGLDEYGVLEDMLYLDEVVRIPGQIYEVRKIKTKKGKTPGAEMAFVKIEWFNGYGEFTVFPERWNACKDWLLSPRAVGIFTLEVNRRGPIFVNGKRFTPSGRTTAGVAQ